MRPTSRRIAQVYAQLEDPELHGMLTRDPGAGVHVTNLHAINGEGLRDMVAALRTRGHDFTEAIAFRPTGWTYRPPAGTETVAPNLNNLISWNQTRNFDARGLYPTRDSSPDYMIYGVPYSEHSSFMELCEWANPSLLLEPSKSGLNKEMISTPCLCRQPASR